MAAFGLVLDDADRLQKIDHVFYLWTDCASAFDFFLRLKTQWRLDPVGRITGLDYQGVQAAMSMLKIPNIERRQLFMDVQIMEQAVILEMSKNDG